MSDVKSGTKGKAKEKTPAKAPSKPAKAVKPAAAKKPPPVQEEVETVEELAGSEADYTKLLPLAQKIDLREAAPRRLDTALACHNAAKGTAAVLELRKAIAAQLPGVKIADIEQIPQIASALAFAELRLQHITSPESDLRARIKRMRELRRLMLGSAIALAEAGVISAKAVKNIQVGTGLEDAVDDTVALATMFRTNAAAVRGKTPVTPAHVKEAAELGAALRPRIKPGRAAKKKEATKEQAEATEMRDRFWMLLVQRYDLVWRVGAFLLGREGVAARVPALQSYAAGKRTADSEAKGDTEVGKGAGDQGTPD
ncbi:MAG: hypothetical protein U0441_26525 [Polyangiaceae bacterium]